MAVDSGVAAAAAHERRCEGEHDEREERVQAADPAMLAGERDLHSPDHCEQRRERDVAPWKPCHKRGNKDQQLKPVRGESHRPVRIERALPGAEDVRTDEIHLDEHGKDDRQRQRDVQPAGAAAYAREQATRRRSPGGSKLDRSAHVLRPPMRRYPAVEITPVNVRLFGAASANVP